MNFERGEISRWFKEMICKEAQEIEKLECVVVSILDENYHALYGYFCDILENPAEIKILRARRCQVLFQIFMPIILFREKDSLTPRGLFISDNALEKYHEELKCKSWILIDDILIHGRGLQNIYEKLDEKYEKTEPGVFVHFKNKNADLRIFDKCINKTFEVFEWEWKKLSCQLVNLIYASTSPYISFVGSYIGEGFVFEEDRYKDSFIVKNNTNRKQLEYNLQSYVLFEKKGIPKFFEQLGYDSCLRIYLNEELNKVTWIPYIFLKNQSKEIFEKIVKFLQANIGGHKLQNTLLELSEKDKYSSEDGLAYRFRLLNALLNHIYGLYIWKKYDNLLQPMIFDVGAFSVCYGEDIAWEFEKLRYEDISQISDEVISDLDFNAICIEEDEELLRAWKRSENKGIDLNERCAMYFFMNWDIDEKLAIRNKKRKQGLSNALFYDSVNNLDRHEMSACQLNCWDSGSASCRIGVKNNIIVPYLAAGEQSFKYILEKFTEIIKEMIYAYNSSTSGKSKKTGRELAYRVYENFVKQQNIYSEAEIKIFKEFVENNIGNLNAWALPEILE